LIVLLKIRTVTLENGTQKKLPILTVIYEIKMVYFKFTELVIY